MKESDIQWTGDTQNFWVGCTPVSPACKGCYMIRDSARYGFDWRTLRRTQDATFYKPLKTLTPRLIFTCSWSDFFHIEADGWRADAWRVIRLTPHHTWQILTKRPERIPECLPEDWGEGWEHVWLGVTVENQDSVHRMELLRSIRAAVRFLSVEPLLGPIVLPSLRDFHWVIVGGDSGHDSGRFEYRPCELEWIESIIQQCREAGVPCFVKQLGTDQYHRLGLSDRHGGIMHEWPLNLRVRQMPNGFIDPRKN